MREMQNLPFEDFCKPTIVSSPSPMKNFRSLANILCRMPNNHKRIFVKIVRCEHFADSKCRQPDDTIFIQ